VRLLVGSGRFFFGKEIKFMAVMDGCESKYRTPVLEERVCPQCGKEVEVFTNRGKIVEEAVCSCGHVFPAEEVEPLKVTRPEEKEAE